MKLTLTFHSKHNQEKRSSVVVEILYACRSLDYHKLQALIEDDDLFLSTEKYQFYEAVKDIFIACKKEGIQELVQFHSVCRLCFSGRRVTSFKDNTGADKLGLVFYPLLSNTTEIIICKRFTDSVNVCNVEVYFAPLYLSDSEKKIFGELMDINKITITKSFRTKGNEDNLKLAIAYYLYDNYKIATKLLNEYLDTHKYITPENEAIIKKLKSLIAVAKLNDPDNKD